MSGLLDYLVEQAKDIDPTAFTLEKATESKKTFDDLEKAVKAAAASLARTLAFAPPEALTA